jgi:transposase
MIPIEFTKTACKKLEIKFKIALKIGNPGQIQKVGAILMLAHKIDMSTIAETWDISERTLYNWINDFIYKGMACFVPVKRSGRKAQLTKEQKQRLAEIIDAGPEAYGFRCGCWNSLIIRNVIDREFRVIYHRHHVCALLKGMGYSYQKGKFTPDKADPAERALWQSQTWPEILASTKAQHAALLFLDEVGFPMWGSLGYTWAKQGHQPLIKTSGIRKNLKVFGAIEYFSGKLVYKTEENKLTSQSYIAFLKVLLQRFSGPIFLIHDGAPYHTSKEVTLFLASQPRIHCIALPTYSPDYNLIEYLWKKVKALTHCKYFATFISLKQCIHASLSFFQKNASEILSLHGVYADELAREARNAA